MGRNKLSDLSDFQDWLTTSLALADSTATMYASKVRTLLPDLSDPSSQEAVTQDFARLAEEKWTRKELSVRRSAWKKFMAYVQSEHDMELPMPRRQGGRPSVPHLPHCARALAARLTQKGVFRREDLPVLVWAYFRPDIPSSTVLALRDPFVPGQEIELERALVQPVLEWAQACIGDSTPLFPLYPGSSTPYPSRSMWRELRIYRRDLMGQASRHVVITPEDAAEEHRQHSQAVAEAASAPPPEKKAFVPTSTREALLGLLGEGTPGGGT